MIKILINILIETWKIIEMSAIYILFGYIVAAILNIFIKPSNIEKYFGKKNIKSIIYISLFGIPLPLCSCGVLPAAISLKKEGASNGAVVAFLISTPESGVDSILFTYSVMDIIMTIARPVSAFITSITAGILTMIFGNEEKLVAEKKCASCKSKIEECENERKMSFIERLKEGFKFAFVDLFTDISGWLLFGLFLAGFISYLIPADFISGLLGKGFLSNILMLIIGIPIYICATASTPIAAALLAKGASPGAVLVFLLAGPATNIASITVLIRFLGRKIVGIYILSICVMTLICGSMLDMIYKAFNIKPVAFACHMTECIPEWLNQISGIILITMIFISLIFQFIKKNKFIKKIKN